MSLYVYLTDEVVNLPLFTTVVKRDRRSGEEYNVYELPGISLHCEKGRWYTIFHQPTEPIPDVIAGAVDEISFLDGIPSIADRESGIYRYKSAEAEVERDLIGKEWKLRVHIRSKTMTDLLELLRMIKAGSIRPELSYEGPQSGLSHAELEVKLEQAEHRFRDACEVHRSLQADLYGLIQRLYYGWPLGSKKKIRQEIVAILEKCL